MNESYFVPGRVNIIGEHTDYNNGLSLAFAIDRGVRVVVTPRIDNATWLVLENHPAHEMGSNTTSHLSIAMAEAAWRRFPRAGVDVTVSSDLPDGAGLSSSAAYIGALCLAFGARGSLLDLARAVQSCEADVGSDVGLLDQIATLGGAESSALRIDFSHLSVEEVALPARWGFSVIHSEVPRALVDSAYRERRRECEEIKHTIGSWSELTDGTLTQLPLTLQPRARHVFTENRRVLVMMTCARTDDLEGAGALLNASHASLRDDFEVSTPVVDDLVARIQTLPGVHGARMIGGGFGGCILAVHEPGVSVTVSGHRSWSVRPSDGGLRYLGR